MMRRQTLMSSLCFAAVVALGLVPCLLLSQSYLGSRLALSLYTLGSAALYIYWLAPNAARGLRAAVVASGLLFGVLHMAGSRHELLGGAAVVIALSRSGILYRSNFYRALLLEVTLLGGSLWFAFELAAASYWSMAWSLWGFYLVQSLYPLVGARERQPDSVSGDAFNDAHNSALAILEQPVQ
jgi:hypothetical protein